MGPLPGPLEKLLVTSGADEVGGTAVLRSVARIAVLCALFLLAGPVLWPQTTRALVTGHVLDAITGQPVPGVTIRYAQLGSEEERTASPDPSGIYVLPLLSPGSYRIRVEAGEQYQPREASSIEIPVAGLLQIDFDLRPINDLWEAGQFRSVMLSGTHTSVNFFGPDVDFSRSGSFSPPARQETRLDSSISTVISPREIDGLPFSGRDVYAAIVLQPAVNSASGTARGLGFSVNGQRRGSANYLLDGVQNNAYLVTGPQVITPVESIQEYRLSLANYSAEYGGTSGFIANAVTQSGLNGFHGLGFFYLINDALNANDVSRRYAGLPRAPYKQSEPGFRVGGPIVGKVLFGSAFVGHLRTRGFSPCQVLLVPSSSAAQQSAAGGTAANLLGLFHPGADTGCSPDFPQEIEVCPLCTAVRIRPPESVNRTTALGRMDLIATSNVRLFGRLAISRLERPDFNFSPYPKFISGLDQNASNALASLEMVRGRATHETRIGYGADLLSFGQRHTGLPALISDDGVSLPSENFGAGFSNRGREFEASHNLLLAIRKNFLKFGGGYQRRDLHSSLNAERGTYEFQTLGQFLNDAPFFFQLNISRVTAASGAITLPDTRRDYRYNQAHWFVQDSWRVTDRLVITGGLRLEYSGAPVNIGTAKDALAGIPRLPVPADRLQQATAPSPVSGEQPVYSINPWALSLRTGLAYSFRNDGRTIVRAGFGTFRDALFDNLWLNVQENQYQLATAGLGATPLSNYYQPAAALLKSAFTGPGSPTLSTDVDSYRLIAFDPFLKTPLTKSGFLALDQSILRNWRVEAFALQSSGANLITNDDVNRKRAGIRPNPALPPVFYRASFGVSRFRSFAIRTAYRARRITLQASYTLSSSFDNQSDALAGDFDLLRTQTQGATAVQGDATFTREFMPGLDYGHSDFDQRHNIVFYSSWAVPSLLAGNGWESVGRGWAFAQTAAIRSGTPFSVLSNAPPNVFVEPLRNNRADLVCQTGYQIDQPLAQGRLLLNPACFSANANAVGNTGRNEFYGPGLWNFDLSLARSFRLPHLPESAKFTLRADFFNTFNHANLGNPENKLSCTAVDPGQGCAGQFGQALYGRTEGGSTFPSVKPFTETGRQIQLSLRFQF